MSTEELLDALIKYDSEHEVKNNRKKLEKMDLKKLLKYKIFQKISKNYLSMAKQLQNKSIDEWDC